MGHIRNVIFDRVGGWMGKLWNWTRHNPLLLTLTTTAAALLIVATLKSNRLAQERSDATAAVRIANEQRDKALSALESLALDTFERLDDGDFDAAQLQRQILIQTLEALDEIDLSRDSQPLDLNRAATLMKLGSICLRMDEVDRARTPLLLARRTLTKLREQTHRPNRREEDFLFIELLGNIAEFYVADNKISSAKADFKEAISTAQTAVTNYGEVEADRLLALAHIHLATSDLWAAAESKKHLQVAHQTLERAFEREPKNEDVKRNLVFGASSLAFAMRESGQVKEATPYWLQALELAEQLHRQTEDNAGLLGNIADAAEGLGDSFCSASKWSQALDYYQRADDRLKEIVRSSGNDADLRLGRWVILHKLSFASGRLGQRPDAQKYHTLANKLMRSPGQSNNARPNTAAQSPAPNEVATVMLELARFFRWHDEFSKSRQYYKSAMESLHNVASKERDSNWHRGEIETLFGLAATADALDDVEGRQIARKTLRQAVRRVQDELDGELAVWLGEIQKRIKLELSQPRSATK